MNPSTLAASFMFNNTPSSSAASSTMYRLANFMEFFFVAHPDSGRKEGEESERILYFDPANESLDKQVADIVELYAFYTRLLMIKISVGFFPLSLIFFSEI